MSALCEIAWSSELVYFGWQHGCLCFVSACFHVHICKRNRVPSHVILYILVNVRLEWVMMHGVFLSSSLCLFWRYVIFWTCSGTPRNPLRQVRLRAAPKASSPQTQPSLLEGIFWICWEALSPPPWRQVWVQHTLGSSKKGRKWFLKHELNPAWVCWNFKGTWTVFRKQSFHIMAP